MWKKAFITLLTLNLLIIAGGAIWFVSQPSASSQTIPKQAAAGEKPATVQLSVGEQAINTYLEYAVSEQADLSGFLSYATVHFNNQWNIKLGVKLAHHVIPLDATFSPTIADGNLQLHMDSANLSGIDLPTSAFFILFRHVPCPNWIHVDADHQNIDINFTERPQHPFGVKVLSYSSQTKMLTLLISILPKSTFPHSSSTAKSS